MQTLLGLTIPVAPISNDYVLEIYDFIDYEGEYILIYDETVDDLSNQYGMVLENNGYQFEGNDEYAGYKDDIMKVYTKDIDDTSYVVILVGYYLGDDEYAPSFEIDAWVESYSVDYETITDWRDEDKTLMEEILTEVIPVAPLTSLYEIEQSAADDGTECIFIWDDYAGDITDAYRYILENSGYTYDSSIDDPTCKTVKNYYKNLDETSDLFIQFYYFLGDDEFYPQFDIVAWIEPIEETYSKWPDAEITHIIESYSLNMCIPAYEGAESYDIIDYSDGEDVYFSIGVYGVDETAVETYKEILDSTNDWTTYRKSTYSIENVEYTTYYAVNGSLSNVIEYSYDDENSALFIDYSCSDVPPKNDWPLTDIQKYIDVEIPGLAGDFYEVYSEIVFIYNPIQDSEQVYIETLNAAGWVVNNTDYANDGYYTAVEPNTNTRISFYYDTADNCFYIFLSIE